MPRAKPKTITKPMAKAKVGSTVPARKATAPKPAAPHRQQQPTGAQTPSMRELCAAAHDIQAPMGAADLCRTTYGR
ncbi:hypothetical protein GCM10010363_61180 [Streptomyces omiyaensis]|nr:hypothetical protein GCM10010363_61180 [Streptomyces omiyaensis]